MKRTSAATGRRKSAGKGAGRHAVAPARAPVPARLPKRERTRGQIVAAAIATMTERGLGQAAVQEIADRAGVTTATFYNHFRDRADLVEAVAGLFSSGMLEAAEEGRRALATGPERTADGCRRYLAIARDSPATALLVLDLAVASPRMLATIGSYVLADIRLGVRQKAFRIETEQAAVDLVEGTIMLAMRRIATRRTPRSYDDAVVATILHGLGVPAASAAALAGIAKGRRA